MKFKGWQSESEMNIKVIESEFDLLDIKITTFQSKIVVKFFY